MPLADTLSAWLSHLSRVCGFETADSFPPGHAYARTRWNPAYFDIPSDMKPDEIERTICAAIRNTPGIFVHVVHPTPRMQRVLIDIIEERQRRACGSPTDLAALLVQAYASRHTLEAVPGLRAVIEASQHMDLAERTHLVLAHLRQHGADIIEA
jgi:hypothetical protein